jgi:dihydrofolate synthase/folylpolyglutamate synthase
MLGENMHLKDLAEWLDWIQKIHFKSIDLGLLRALEVGKRLNVLTPSCAVIAVAGTNGKGSTVAGLEAIYGEAGYCVAAFTSPYLFRFNEQFRLSGKEVSDEAIKEAFERVENARGDISLTSFEFYTLAAFDIFSRANVDVCILEVGLGGRLDAVNIMDADIAIVTSIDLDHVALLGNTREKIAHEKAGIFRAGKPAISGDFNPPGTLKEDANTIGAPLFLQGQQFAFEDEELTWNWWSEKLRFNGLPKPRLLLQNMSTVLMAIELLQSRLPVKREAIENGLKKVKLPGRIQVVEGEIPHVYDVSHNPAAVLLLSDYLKKHPVLGKTHAVFSMLGDKDINETIRIIQEDIDQWYVAEIANERRATLNELKQHFLRCDIDSVLWFDSMKEASGRANQEAVKGDRVLVFGSFHTVAEGGGI